MSMESIFNFIRVSDSVATGGQPTQAQIEAARDEGVEAVVNLAPHDQQKGALPDERGLVESLGMTYHHIPVDWMTPLEENFTTFVQTMDGLRDRKVLVHCAANYRVTAFYSTYAMKKDGWSAQQADALIARIWESRPEVRMDATWRTFLYQIRAF
jgi:protein tyrosine phosphatase (PTP) superfamily phosphohydrolase (DUF442 family)